MKSLDGHKAMEQDYIHGQKLKAEWRADRTNQQYRKLLDED